MWKGVAGAVDVTGAVAGVCEGGPIYRNNTDYFAYEASACGGVGGGAACVCGDAPLSASRR